MLEQGGPRDPVYPGAEEPLGPGLVRARMVAVEPGHAREPEAYRAPSPRAHAARKRRLLVIRLRLVQPALLLEQPESVGHLAVDPLLHRRIGAAGPRSDEAVGGSVDEDVPAHA